MHATPATTRSEDRAFDREAIPYLRRLYPAALRLTHQPCDAEDLVQETLTRGYLKFRQFTPGTNLGAWLYRIMLTTFYSTCRRSSRRPPVVLPLTPELAERTAPAARSAEDEALGELRHSKAVRALAELPAPYKSVIYLADIESYRYSEISDVLGIPLGTVMSRAHRGHAMLRSRLSPEASPGPASAGPPREHLALPLAGIQNRPAA